MNPYNAYQAPQMTSPSGGGGGAVEPAQFMILAALKRTRPWVLFLSILGFLAAGLMLLFGFLAMAAGAATSGFSRSPIGNLGPVVGLLYMAIGGFYMVPAYLLWRYAASIRDYDNSTGSMELLAVAVERQASFWRFIGILTAVVLGVEFLILFIALIVGVASAVHR